MVQIQAYKKERAIALRFQGKSYNEIRRILKISSKGTLSCWFRDLKLPVLAQKRLAQKILFAKKRGLFKFNKERTESILKENKEIQTESLKEISQLSKRELLLVGVALYWGEGTKINKNKRSAGVCLSNSDSSLIRLFLRFIREILMVNENKIRAGIQIHENIDALKTKRYWANITKLPIDRFYITKQISSASRFRRPKKFLPYGTAIIKVNNRRLAYRIKGYITGLSLNLK